MKRIRLLLCISLTISGLGASAHAEPSTGKNLVAGHATRATSKLLLTPRIVTLVNKLIDATYDQQPNTNLVAQSLTHGFNSQTKADATAQMLPSQETPFAFNTTRADAQTSLPQDIFQGELSVQTDIIIREVLARLVNALKIATIEQNGAFRLAMDYFGTTYEVSSDIMNSYNALHTNTETSSCNGMRISASVLGFITAYENLLISGAVASHVKNPVLSTMAYLAVYMILDPILKRLSNYVMPMGQCPGASELYGFGGDFCYFATGVVPDNIKFAHQVH